MKLYAEFPDLAENFHPTFGEVFQIKPPEYGGNAEAEHILEGHSAWVNGEMLKGSMPDNGAGGGEISAKDETVPIPKGYYNGEGSVGISEEEIEKIQPGNIRKGVTLLGVEGKAEALPEYEGSYEVTPAIEAQTLETEGKTMTDDVEVKPIPFYETSNNAGGNTAIIGG